MLPKQAHYQTVQRSEYLVFTGSPKNLFRLSPSLGYCQNGKKMSNHLSFKVGCGYRCRTDILKVMNLARKDQLSSHTAICFNSLYNLFQELCKSFTYENRTRILHSRLGRDRGYRTHDLLLMKQPLLPSELCLHFWWGSQESNLLFTPPCWWRGSSSFTPSTETSHVYLSLNVEGFKTFAVSVPLDPRNVRRWFSRQASNLQPHP